MSSDIAKPIKQVHPTWTSTHRLARNSNRETSQRQKIQPIRTATDGKPSNITQKTERERSRRINRFRHHPTANHRPINNQIEPPDNPAEVTRALGITRPTNRPAGHRSPEQPTVAGGTTHCPPGCPAEVPAAAPAVARRWPQRGVSTTPLKSR